MTNPQIISPDTQRQNRVPPGQNLTEKWPVLHYGKIPAIETARWTFSITGLVEKEVVLTYDEFMSLPKVEVFSDIHCVTTWSKLNNLWSGIATETIKGIAQIKPEARFVIIHCSGGFTTNLLVEDFFQPDVLFAVRHNGENLTPEHGYPVRLIVPRLYLWKSAKWVTGIKFVNEDEPGFWERHGYHKRGDPWQEQRYGY